MSIYGKFVREFEVLCGQKISTNSLSERIIAQKVAYLVYKKGISSTYTNFSWYIYGVFSSSLWNDTIRLYDPQSEKLPAEHEDLIKKMGKEFLDAGLIEYLSSADKLELITTILYKSKRQEDLEENNTELIYEVKNAKDKFNNCEKEIKVAISKLKKIQWNFE